MSAAPDIVDRDALAAGGYKADHGKLRYDLVPADALEDLVEIFTFGANKYADRNWEAGMAWGRVFAAVMRHLWAFWRGESIDRESGLPHTAHAMWGCMVLTSYIKRAAGTDDRPWVETEEVVHA